MTRATPLATIAFTQKSPSRKRGGPRTTHPIARARGSFTNTKLPMRHGRPGRAGVGLLPHTAGAAVAHRDLRCRGVVR